jgi:hypothetical protein
MHSLLSREPAGGERPFAGARMRPHSSEYAVAPRPREGEPATEAAFFVPAGSPPQKNPFTSVEEVRRDAAFAAGRSTSVLDVKAERIPVGEARETLVRERARVAALEEKLAILTHHCSTWGRETDRAGYQVKAAAAMAEMHPRGAEHHGRTFATHYIRQHAELTEELEAMFVERERVFAQLRKAISAVEHLKERLAVANTSFASRKAISDSNRQRYFHSLFYYDWKGAA